MGVKGGQIKKKKRLVKVILACLSFVMLSQSFIWLCALPADAAVLSVEILDNLATTNNSGTSPTVRWTTSSVDKPVMFTVTGKSLANASVNLVGAKQAVLVIPVGLVNRVHPQVGVSAQVETHVLLDLSKISALTSILGLVTTLLNTVNTVLDNPLLSINLTDFNKAVAGVYDLENFMAATFQEPLNESPDGRSLSVLLDKGLGPILAAELSKRLTALTTATAGLKVTGGIPLVNAAANLVLQGAVSPLVTAIGKLVQDLSNPLGNTVQQLVDGSVLGDTTVKMPTLVSGPTQLANDYEAQFVGTVIKSSLIDINLLSTSTSRSSIYFSGERLNFDEALLPDSLKFGSHLIQTTKDETFVANNGTADTKGKIALTETRVGTKKWQVKVSQEQAWLNTSRQLGSSRLKIYGGGLTSSFSTGQVTSIGQGQLELVANEQKEILSLAQTTETGQVSLDLAKFELFVPKNTPKVKGDYQTVIRWTVTEGP